MKILTDLPPANLLQPDHPLCMQPVYIDRAAEVAQKAPLTFVVVLLALGLLAVLLGAMALIWKGGPMALAWLTAWQQRSHEQQRALLTERSTDATADVARATVAATASVDSAHREIGQRVDAVHKDVRLIMIKVGAGVLLVFLASLLGSKVNYAETCSPACTGSLECCATAQKPNACCEPKKDTAINKKASSVATKPHSALRPVRMASFAGMGCNRGSQNCSGS